MAYFVEKIPDLQMSDVDELIRETAMDSSNGQKIMEYIRRKRGGVRVRLNNLFDAGDNAINFRLDDIAPLPLSQPTDGEAQERSSGSLVPVSTSSEPVAAATGANMIQTHSALSPENRRASFVSPMVAVSRLSKRMLQSPFVSYHDSPALNLNKQALLQHYKRTNQKKFEQLRSAQEHASSTPIVSNNLRNDNFMNIQENISPIGDAEQLSVPKAASPARQTTQKSAGSKIMSPVPATQDIPDGLERRYREKTPPREGHLDYVVPETPSPVRRSSPRSNTPLRALSITYRSDNAVAPPLNSSQQYGNSSRTAARYDVADERSSPNTSQRSILKKRCSNQRVSQSPKNRVSFSTRMVMVREISPTPSQFTSDDSDNNDEEPEVRAKPPDMRRSMRPSNLATNVYRSRMDLDRLEHDENDGDDLGPTTRISRPRTSDKAAVKINAPSNAFDDQDMNFPTRTSPRKNHRMEVQKDYMPSSPSREGARSRNNRTNSYIMHMNTDDREERRVDKITSDRSRLFLNRMEHDEGGSDELGSPMRISRSRTSNNANSDNVHRNVDDRKIDRGVNPFRAKTAAAEQNTIRNIAVDRDSSDDEQLVSGCKTPPNVQHRMRPSSLVTTGHRSGLPLDGIESEDDSDELGPTAPSSRPRASNNPVVERNAQSNVFNEKGENLPTRTSPRKNHRMEVQKDYMPSSPSREGTRSRNNRTNSDIVHMNMDGREDHEDDQNRTKAAAAAEQTTHRAREIRRKYGRTRSNAFEEPDGNSPTGASPRKNHRLEALKDYMESSPPRKDARSRNNQTNSDIVNMIMDDWGDCRESQGVRPSRASSAAAAEPPTHRTMASPVPITNIDTPRTVQMDIVDPPSAFCDDESDSDLSGDELQQMECDDQATNRSHRSSSPNQDKRTVRTHDGFINEENFPDEHHTTRIGKNLRLVSADSPNDVVPMVMLKAVDMIHSQVDDEQNFTVNQAPLARTTVVMTSRRHTTKPKIDVDTESYFKTIEDKQKSHENQKKSQKERRKLFGSNMNDPPTEDDQFPEPLPPRAEDAVTQSAPRLKPLSVVVKRLSSGTLKRTMQLWNGADSSSDSTPCGSEAEVEIEIPVVEKQNEERSEKTYKSKYSDVQQPVSQSTDPQQLNQQTGSKSNNKVTRSRIKTKESTEKPQKSVSLKKLKDVSNEIRVQVEGDEPRRSRRNRRIAAEVLWNNPTISRNDAPLYIMPTVDDIIHYYRQMEKESKKSKTKSAKNARNDKAKRPEKIVHETPVDGGSHKDNKKKKKVTIEESIDHEGFRIPSVPVNKQKKQKKIKDTSTMTSPTVQFSTLHAVSSDSGLSSAGLTNDEVTVPETSAQPSTSKSAEPSSHKPTTTAPGMEDLLAEKRKTFDWMLMLMENQELRPEALPMVEIQGFTHLSLDHLAFQRRDLIEYSFYVYSNGDNFGFIRFLPNAKKKMTRTKNCLLKFLVLSGSIKFIINDYEVNVVGGDFLMLPVNSTYRTINGSVSTLMFMIKTSVPSS